jgi:hypothetical protein
MAVRVQHDESGTSDRAKSQMIYLANKVHGEYEYVGVDWNSGAIKAH